jgi:hypothetical protein
VIDINYLIQSVLKDRHGRYLQQSVMHNIWHSHVEWCMSTGNKMAGILAPFGSGKTENMIIGRTLQFLGEDRNLRIKIICDTDKNAIDRLRSIKNYIEDDADYHKFYPDIKPAITKRSNNKKKKAYHYDTPKYEKWSEHKFNIERESKMKDTSVEGWGILSSGLGGRADVMFFDDIISMKNSIQEPALVPKIKDTFRGTWLSRLEPDGIVIYIATVWTDRDLTYELRNDPAWSFCIMSVTEDMDNIEVRFTNIDNTHPCYTGRDVDYIELWEPYFSKEALKQKLLQLHEANYNRGFRQIPYASEDLVFKSFMSCLDKDYSVESWISHARKEAKNSKKTTFATGVDLSGAKRPGSVIFTVGVLEGENKIVPVDIRSGKWSSPQLAKQIEEVYRAWRPIVINVENVALQEMLLEWMRLYMSEGKMEYMPIEGFMTGKQKSDPMIGLPSMELEFKNGMWLIPFFDQRHDDDNCDCPWCTWKREMSTYPFASTTDTVMSCWFAREGIRRYAMGGSIMTEDDYNDVLKNRHSIANSDVDATNKIFERFYHDAAGKERYSEEEENEQDEEYAHRW